MAKKRKSKHTQAYWKRQLDPLMSKLVREKGYCERCKRTTGVLNDAHIIGRINLTLRWDIFNHLCLCYQCHRYFWHEEPLESSQWFQKKYPGRYEYLMKVKNKVNKRTEEDYIQLRKWIKNKKIDKLHFSTEELFNK